MLERLAWIEPDRRTSAASAASPLLSVTIPSPPRAGRRRQGDGAAQRRAEQVDRIGRAGLLGIVGQQQPQRHAAEEEWCRQRQVVQDQDEHLRASPRHAEGVERQPVGQQVGPQQAQAGRQRQLRQPLRRVAAQQGGEDRQGRPAGAKTQQRHADDHEGKVVELRHREQPRQVDLEGQRGRGEQEQAEPERRFDAGR